MSANQKPQPVLNRRLMEVLDLVSRHPYKTARELESKAAGEIFPVDTVHKRISDLAHLGYVTSLSRRSCSVTGHKALVWSVTQRGSDACQTKKT